MLRWEAGLALALACLAPPAAIAQTAPASPVAPQSQRPNVLVWMIDDLGFAQMSCFGGLVPTPNIDRVAARGLRYTNYHTSPICSASRAAFLTGRNPHTVHIGGHAVAARDLPAHDAKIPPGAGTIAANLKAAGYATYAFGKWDHLPTPEVTPAGPFTRWPAGQGFDHFYGFLAADTDNWNPTLVRDLAPVARPQTPDYHLSADLADQAIAQINQRDATGNPQPFFIYWATGAAHAPHHAPKEWIARFKGQFDQGWDQARATILKRQIVAGIVPKHTKLAERPEGMPAWASLTTEQKQFYAHQMEVFAASLAYADAQFGRLLDSLQARGELDQTLVLITSDNGASAEGGPDGIYNEGFAFTGPPAWAENVSFMPEWGGPKTYPHYAMGWAVAGDTPYRFYKQTTHEGGTHVPLVIAYPKHIPTPGTLRRGFVHVSDLAPTILDAVGVSLAPVINNVPQMQMEGQSIKATFRIDANPAEGRAQYVELYGNKGLWFRNWSIVTSHMRKSWDMMHPKHTFDEPWELYNLTTDPGQTTDLATRRPQQLAEMARLFDEQAAQHHVTPQFNLADALHDAPAKAAADFARHGGVWRYAGPVADIPGTMAPPLFSRSFTFSATLDLPSGTMTGPVFAHGGQMGGIGLYLKDGHPLMLFNAINGNSATVLSPTSLASGSTQLVVIVARGSIGLDGAADYAVTISANGSELTRQTVNLALRASELFGLGNDSGSPLLAGYHAGVPFAGRISNAEFDFVR